MSLDGWRPRCAAGHGAARKGCGDRAKNGGSIRAGYPDHGGAGIPPATKHLDGSMRFPLGSGWV